MKDERPEKGQLWMRVENGLVVAVIGVGAAKRNPLVRYSYRARAADPLSYTTVKMCEFLKKFQRVKSCADAVDSAQWYQKDA